MRQERRMGEVMNNKTSTPRTDEIIKNFEHLPNARDVAMVHHAKQLEQELAEVHNILQNGLDRDIEESDSTRVLASCAISGIHWRDEEIAEYKAVYDLDVTWEKAKVKEAQAESMSLLRLIADIRAAVGDPTGKLMQDELISRCGKLTDFYETN